ncbi:eukaryotic translation initiation factor 3 subunit B [Brassica rapa]|uniref:eukaryotic translation initiation factor 3 subunit B n=1 Tax=Brassica campestris TaxID=3711 RepID=UPI00142E4DF5|nr:eukaryotic translation initiation factor 3 subunit B [Brassica rapa]
MATADNFMATDIKWDPTGRYVATVVTSSVMEDGFYIWSLMGSCFTEHSRNKSFRAKGKRGEKDLRQSMERYEEEDEDEEVLDLLSRQEMEKRRVMEEEWEMWINKWKQLHEEEKLQTQNLLVREKKRKKSIIMRPLRS